MGNETGNSGAGFGVLESGRLLRRYYYIERQSLRILAGWLPEVAQWEAKQAIGRHIWDEAQHAERLRGRLRELRGGHPNADVEPGLAFLMEEALHAPGAAGLAAGLYLGLKRRLLEAYRAHIAHTSYVVDAPTADLLQTIVWEEEKHLAWAEAALPALLEEEDEPGAALEWQDYIERLVAAAGGLAGDGPRAETAPARPAAYRPFRRSGKARRDKRFVIQPGWQAYPNLAEMDSLPLRENMIAQFRLNFSEMWAAELVASVIFDMQDMPWEFYHDLARQCWDEVRHSEMGEMRLKELGVGLGDYPMAVSEYERCVRMPPMHRFCDLTMMAEAPHIKVRPPRFKRWTAEGDLRSAMFIDYDWSDEISHVAFGNKWLKHMLKDDARTIEDVVAECEAMRRRLAEESPDFRLPGYFFENAEAENNEEARP